MKRLLALLAAGLALGLACTHAAEPKKEKAPGDAEAEAFFKLRDDKEAKLDGERIQKLQKAGLDFLAAYPTHGRANSVVNALANFGSTMKDKKQQPLRDYWGSSLGYEIVNRRTKSDVTDDVRAVFSSLDAAYAGYLARSAASRETLETYRGKIDRLSEVEGGARYLPNHERDYVQVLLAVSPKQGEAQVRKLMESSDKKLAAVGREEMNLIELSRTPLELKATALDGKEFDAATLRGKAVCFVFWSSTHEASVKELGALAELAWLYKKQGLEVVAVSHDTDRAALEKFAKSKNYSWPVLFDGQGNKGEFSVKLNAKNVPAIFLFNQQGMLVRIGLKASGLEAELVKLGFKRAK